MAVAAKIPLPRMLGEKETMESLKHWKVTFKTYYRRDSVFKIFSVQNKILEVFFRCLGMPAPC